MVKYLYAVVTDTAVAAPRRSVELTGDTPLHPYSDPVDLDVPIERSPEIVISVLVWTGTGDDARVHESRHGEVDQHEEGDDALKYWHGVPLLLVDVPLVTREVEK